MSGYEDPFDFDPFPGQDYWDDRYDEDDPIYCSCICGCNAKVERPEERCSMCAEACFPGLDYDE